MLCLCLYKSVNVISSVYHVGSMFSVVHLRILELEANLEYLLFVIVIKNRLNLLSVLSTPISHMVKAWFRVISRSNIRSKAPSVFKSVISDKFNCFICLTSFFLDKSLSESPGSLRSEFPISPGFPHSHGRASVGSLLARIS